MIKKKSFFFFIFFFFSMALKEEDVPRDIEGWSFDSFDTDYLGEVVTFHSTTETELTAVFCIDDIIADWVCKVAFRGGSFFLDIEMEVLTPREIRRVLEEDISGRLEAITEFAGATRLLSTGWLCKACGNKEEYYFNAYKHFVTTHYNRTSVKSALKT